MPHDLPDWQLVYHSFALWKKNGTLKRIHDALRGKVRSRAPLMSRGDSLLPPCP
jgi:putative transposase